MRTTSETVIDGQKYMVGHWHIDKQLDVLTRLIKLLGESVVMAIFASGVTSKSQKDSIMDSVIDPNMAQRAVAGLVARLNEAEVKTLFREAMEGVRCNGKEIEFNTHFMGRIGLLMKVFIFSVRHQYSDFLDVIPALVASAGKATHQDAQI